MKARMHLFYETLTVREHLIFQGKLRFGGVVSRQEIVHRVDQIMREFGVEFDGWGARVRGISGGERKRLTLAAEVLGDPVIFFVDEPTSGLDSFIVGSVMMQLQRIARQGKTGAANDLRAVLGALCALRSIVLDGERFDGARWTEDTVAYFSSQGHSCPASSNPAEYFMRQLAVSGSDWRAEFLWRLLLHGCQPDDDHGQ